MPEEKKESAENLVKSFPVYTMKDDLDNSLGIPKKVVEKDITFSKAVSPFESSAKLSSDKKIVPDNLPITDSPSLTFREPKESLSKAEVFSLAPESSFSKPEDSSVSVRRETGSISSRTPFVREKTIQKVRDEKLLVGKKRKIWTALIIFLVLIIAGEGYYFWVTINKEEFSSMEAPETQLPAEIPIKQLFSLSSANYLRIDVENTTTDSVREIINQTAEEIILQNVEAPVEFIVTDANNNPLSFTEFSQRLAINLPAEVVANLGEKFSLFLFNERGKVKVGLTIDTVDGDKLKDIMLEKEADIPLSLAPLFLVSDYSIPAKSFDSSLYKDVIIRYFNIISPEELSIDYALYQNKLIIGTTKSTARAIIDTLVE